MKKIGVIHVIDSLELGGAERMAVSLANHISRDRFHPFLCATRCEGPLKDNIESEVGYLHLCRKNTFDIKALLKFAAFIQEHQIQIIHAHSLSLFFSAAAVMMLPHGSVQLVWHDHYGRGDIQPRNPFFYRLLLKKCQAVVAVNPQLAKWARESVGFRHVFYIPNFAEANSITRDQQANLPGIPEKRIICVANLRPEKDQETLLKAVKIIANNERDVHLLLVGSPVDEKYAGLMQDRIVELGLENHATCLGRRTDISTLLRQCAIGVLSSRSEGLPVVLLEYGTAGMAVIATDVGQCGELIQNNRTGLLVKPSDPHAMAQAILQLLSSPKLRDELGRNFLNLIKDQYMPESVVKRIEGIYDLVLGIENPSE